jgi:flagellar L-ring protein precursor FlgH
MRLRHEQRILLLACTVGIALLTTGCATSPTEDGRDFTATWPDEAQQPATTPGAIYAQGTEVSLWQNVTARNVGDTLTIRLAESTSAEKNASTTASKSSTAEMTGPTIFGRPVTVNGTPILEGSLDNQTDFSGNGASKQSNALDGAISVTVAKRFANGNLLVRGQKWITINTGREFVRVEGIVRPSDIAPDNSVLSWKVADAYISYGGNGTVANASKPGWLYRFFNSPHTPF